MTIFLKILRILILRIVNLFTCNFLKHLFSCMIFTHNLLIFTLFFTRNSCLYTIFYTIHLFSIFFDFIDYFHLIYLKHDSFSFMFQFPHDSSIFRFISRMICLSHDFTDMMCWFSACSGFTHISCLHLKFIYFHTYIF